MLICEQIDDEVQVERTIT